VDDAGAGFTVNGTWVAETSGEGGYGAYGETYRRAEAGDHHATFAPVLPGAGQYRVSVWCSALAGAATNQRFLVFPGSGPAITVTGSVGDCVLAAWKPLGTFTLTSGSTLEIDAGGADGTGGADAALWEGVAPAAG
jgi:hypothetical protein